MDTAMLGSDNLVFELATGDRLSVRTFDVQERIGQPFRVSLTIVDTDPDLDLEVLVGEGARFEISTGRAWVGVIRAFELIQVESTGLSSYRLELVPALWLLSQRTNYRIFQRLTEPDIVRELLDEWQITFDPRIDATAYKRREYRVQYGESDFAFVSRILEDAGITYWFETREDQTVLVLSDAPQTGAVRGPLTHVGVMPSPPVKDLVTRLSVSREIRSGRHTVRDADFRVPPRHPLMSSSSSVGNARETSLESYHYEPGAFLFEGEGSGTPRADDKITVRSDQHEGERLAQRRLEAERSQARSFRFHTNALDLRPGIRVAVIDHPRSDLGLAHPLLVTETALHGAADTEWTMMCRATRSDAPFRSPRWTPKPRVSGVEMATVVGAVGDEIHTDEFGRVRVHFHWDRESHMDDDSSCWVPVSHPWAGAAFGAMNLPRVGQEVVVDFLGGDPDRPMVIGRVHTALQPVPNPLPENQTQSGWRSSSTGGTGGYNEIMFEDRAGEELVRMQAERDLQTLVKHDETRTVKRNRNTSVRGQESTSVGGSRSVSVKGAESSFVGKSATRQVVQSDSLAVGENATMIVSGNRTASATNDTFTVTDSFEVKVDGPDGPFGTLTMTPKKIVMTTDLGAKLTLEEGYVLIEAEGILLNGKSVILSADQNLDLHGGDVKAEAGKTLTLTGTATAELGSLGPTTVKGTPVMLNGPGLLAGRVTDLSPAAVMTGAALVLVGGPSFPFPIEKLDDGSLKIGNNIVVKPDLDFQNKVLRDLGIMSSTPVGLARLVAIDVNPGGHQITIQPYSAEEAAEYGADNSLCYADGDGAYRGDDGFGNPELGPGSGSTISYNPAIVSGPPGSPAPPDATLHHELGHAEHNAYGNNRSGEPMDNGWDNREEWQTIEGGPNADNDYYEHRNFPYRNTDHNGGWENADGTPIVP